MPSVKLSLEIICVNPENDRMVENVIRLLNSRQSAFEYRCYPEQLRIDSLRKQHYQYGYKSTDIYDFLNRNLKGYHPHLIVVIDEYLEGKKLFNLFSGTEEDDYGNLTGKAIISLFQLKDLLKGIPIENYLLLKFLDIAIRFVAKKPLIHDSGIKQCIYSRKTKKSIIREVLRYGNFCIDCYRTLSNTLDDEQLSAISEILNDIRQISLAKDPQEKLKTLVDQQADSSVKKLKIRYGIITALPKEFVAVKVLLEDPIEICIPEGGARRRYLYGAVPSKFGGKHLVVLTLTEKGNNRAAIRATLLLQHFPHIKSIIMVGIAGGVPNPMKPEDHVRFGDIVVSAHRGVVQYDFVSEKIEEVEYRSPPRPPSAELRDAARYLETEELQGNRPWLKFIEHGISELKWERPSENTDILIDLDTKRQIKHPKDNKRIAKQPRVFQGVIASANTLLRNPKTREKLRDKFGAKAVEMEASGIADATWEHECGYLVVRGICDYCDPKKNDIWQEYASIVAAAYTRALLEEVAVDPSLK
ncbi:MAG: 5'-methylthioadenosine/S-adenosylhomocysteine nucleosidase [Candidatus Hermodarchaeota archaeon]